MLTRSTYVRKILASPVAAGSAPLLVGCLRARPFGDRAYNGETMGDEARIKSPASRVFDPVSRPYNIRGGVGLTVAACGAGLLGWNHSDLWMNIDVLGVGLLVSGAACFATTQPRRSSKTGASVHRLALDAAIKVLFCRSCEAALRLPAPRRRVRFGRRIDALPALRVGGAPITARYERLELDAGMQRIRPPPPPGPRSHLSV